MLTALYLIAAGWLVVWATQKLFGKEKVRDDWAAFLRDVFYPKRG